MDDFVEYRVGIIGDYLKDKDVHITTTGRGKRRKTCYDLAVAFDIETTSAYYDAQQFAYYRTDAVTDAQKKTLEKRAWMYIWQMAIDDFAFYGRLWEDFVAACYEMKEVLDKATVVIYVHNLAFEFQWISSLLAWQNIFAVDSRRVVYAETTNGLCFRCSYLESGVGLAKLSEQTKTKKLDGDLDYKVLRTSLTELTAEEMAYCRNDVIVLTEYINRRIAERGSVNNILLTKTGYVREWCRDYCMRSQAYRDRMETLTMTADEYHLLKAAFAGGFTHASEHNAGVVFDSVTSHDITSSYPTVMCCELFPMSKGQFVKIENGNQFNDLIKNKLCVFEIEFDAIKAKTTIENILSKSKCTIWRNGDMLQICDNAVVDNGRIVSASRLVTTITNIDYFQLRKFYSWGQQKVGKVIAYEPGYLPKRFIECCIHFYKQKTELKDVDGREMDYALYKSMLNSIYGMTVMDIVREQHDWKDGEWDSHKENENRTIARYNESKKRFMYYPWGVFITAYARRNVQDAILALGEDYIYTDTDSVKFVNAEKHKDFFAEYDRKIDEKMRHMCDLLHLDYADTRPTDIYGKQHPLGYFDMEYVAEKFKTLGAKRYMVQIDGKTKTTVAGVGKKAGAEFFRNFDAFNIGAKIPPGKAGKQMLTYIDKVGDEWWIYDDFGNSEIMRPVPFIHMEEAGYEMTAPDDYKRILEMNNKEVLLL